MVNVKEHRRTIGQESTREEDSNLQYGFYRILDAIKNLEIAESMIPYPSGVDKHIYELKQIKEIVKKDLIRRGRNPIEYTSVVE